MSWPEVMDWAWARHHNEWSWYIRPLILIAFCYAAWSRSLVFVLLFALMFPVSAVLFPAPDQPKDFVLRFLAAERNLLEAMSAVELIGFVVAVGVFLSLLAACLWKRSFWLGVLVANAGGALKLAFSLYFWGETGQAALLPTFTTALVFNLAALVFWSFVLVLRTSKKI